MTPKQKAEELWWSYYSTIEHTLSEEYSPHESYIAKQCALIAINEMIKTSEEAMLFKQSKRDWLQEVKQEIEQL